MLPSLLWSGPGVRTSIFSKNYKVLSDAGPELNDRHADYNQSQDSIVHLDLNFDLFSLVLTLPPAVFGSLT